MKLKIILLTKKRTTDMSVTSSNSKKINEKQSEKVKKKHWGNISMSESSKLSNNNP